LSDKDYIEKQISNMTVEEQKLISTEKFERLWTKLWGNSRDLNSIEYETALQKFDAIDKSQIVKNVPSKFSDPEWGFPKGRRMRGETDLQCAVREYFEETNIPEEAYTIKEQLVFTEVFVGTNNVKYKHIYFVALLKNSSFINLSQKLTASQRREISSVAWKTLKECKNITRPHYVERKQMLTELEKTISLASQ
jgi:8-oxo-dGTP pyrophosphatase MutT (NUDIX family)